MRAFPLTSWYLIKYSTVNEQRKRCL